LSRADAIPVCAGGTPVSAAIAPGRYRFHDLLRLYAREQASHRHPEPERAAALVRAFGLYVADGRWRKGGVELADAATALDWLDAERANLLAAVRQAAATPGVPAALGADADQVRALLAE
jgi:hypothetical protein